MLEENDIEKIRNIVKEYADGMKDAVANGIREERGTRPLTKEDILNIPNRSKRQRAIKENLDLFM